eukprot:5742289-Prorocentrum_lima.AAC.2
MQASAEYIKSCLDVLPVHITPDMCPTIRGKLGWLCATCAPHLAFVSRVDDEVLQEVGARAIKQLLHDGPPLMLHSLDLFTPIHITCMMDSSMESRVVTKVQAREAGLFFLHNQGGKKSLVSWFSRLHKRKAVSSNVAECRAVVSSVLHARYLNHLLVWLQHQAGSSAGVKAHLLTDSQSIISFLANPLAVHSDLDWIVLKQECKYLESKAHVRDKDNAADALTKVPQAAGPQYQVLYGLMNPGYSLK